MTVFSCASKENQMMENESYKAESDSENHSMSLVGLRDQKNWNWRKAWMWSIMDVIEQIKLIFLIN